jgi:hypothetical protein
MTEAPQARAPRIVTAVLAVLAVVLAVGVAVLVYQRGHHESGLGLTSEESRVLDQARQKYITLQTFHYDDFDQDFANASAVVTGAAKQNLTSIRTQLQQTLVAAKRSATASILSASIESHDGATYQVLILASLDQLDSSNKVIQARPSPARLTMVRSGDQWLISDVGLVAVS